MDMSHRRGAIQRILFELLFRQGDIPRSVLVHSAIPGIFGLEDVSVHVAISAEATSRSKTRPGRVRRGIAWYTLLDLRSPLRKPS